MQPPLEGDFPMQDASSEDEHEEGQPMEAEQENESTGGDDERRDDDSMDDGDDAVFDQQEDEDENARMLEELCHAIAKVKSSFNITDSALEQLLTVS